MRYCLILKENGFEFGFIKRDEPKFSKECSIISPTNP